MNLEQDYSFDLTTEEIFWLSGMFGLLHFPFIEIRSRANYDTASLRRGQIRLQERGWIQYQPSRGWRVDPLPAAVMRWITDAGISLSVLIRSRNEKVRRCDLYRFEDAGLVITFEEEMFHFHISYHYANLLIFLKLLMPDLVMEEFTAPGSYNLIQPEEMVLAAWNKAAGLPKAISRQGFLDRENQLLIKWLKGMTWFGQLTCQRTIKPLSTPIRLFVCGDNTANWSAEEDMATGRHLLLPANGKAIHDWLGKNLEYELS